MTATAPALVSQTFTHDFGGLFPYSSLLHLAPPRLQHP